MFRKYSEATLDEQSSIEKIEGRPDKQA